jgi:hypothetical protein
MEKPRPLPQRRRSSQNRRAQQQEEQQCHIDAEPLLTSDEARRIAANIAKLLELLAMNVALIYAEPEKAIAGASLHAIRRRQVSGSPARATE